MSLAGKTLFITGATRGIGLAIGLRAARDGANVVIAGKTDAPHPLLPNTIHSAAEQIEAAGGQALAVVMDVRDSDAIRAAVRAAEARFGGIDVLVNNASAIFVAGVEQTPSKRFDLMQHVNTRGTFLASQACLPLLRQAANPHILNISPPLDFSPRWFGPHVAYSISKYGMSLCVLGMAEELLDAGVAVNALWPRTTVATSVSAVGHGDDGMAVSRRPEIMADAAYEILNRPSRTCTGNFFIDDSVLYEAGVRDFSGYSVTPGLPLRPDLFVPADDLPPPGVELADA
jgi:citronellol/citronellal dehydrogenase